MGAGRAQQSQLPEEGSEQDTLILPAWVSGKDQMGVEGIRGRVSEAARGLKSKAGAPYGSIGSFGAPWRMVEREYSSLKPGHGILAQ